MTPLRRRILVRGLPVAIGAAILGYFVSQGYKLAEVFGNVQVVESDTINFRAPLIFGVVGFLTVVALECVRKNKNPGG